MRQKYFPIKTEEQFLRYSDILDTLIRIPKEQRDPETRSDIILLTFLIDMYHDWFYDELLENINLNEDP